MSRICLPVACRVDGTSLTDGRSLLEDLQPAISGGGLGDNVIVNGTFDADTNWTKDSGWVIAAGVATITEQGGTRNLRQTAVPFVDSADYEVEYTVSGYVSGSVTAQILGDGLSSGTPRSANGTYTETINAGSAPTSFRMRSAISSALSVDNITVREVL